MARAAGSRPLPEGSTSRASCRPAAHDPARHRDHTAWRDSAVRAILANPHYSGYQVWARAARAEILLDPTDVAAGVTIVQRWASEDRWYRSEGPSHEALVTPDLLEAVQERFRVRLPSDEVRATQESHGTYPLQGLACCDICGQRLQGELRRGRRYYRCPTTGSARSEGDGHPVSVYLREDVVVRPLDKWLAEALSQEAAERSAQQLATNRYSAELAAREKAAKRSLADADRKIARLEQALEDGLPSPPSSVWPASMRSPATPPKPSWPASASNNPKDCPPKSSRPPSNTPGASPPPSPAPPTHSDGSSTKPSASRSATTPANASSTPRSRRSHL